jgi:hypothetical protein
MLTLSASISRIPDKQQYSSLSAENGFGDFWAQCRKGVVVVSANGIYPDIHNFRTPYMKQFSL